MKLAKPRIDVGLFTNNLQPMLDFWQGAVGLPFEEALPLGGGVRQHRHGMNGSVLKINHARDPLPDAPRSGYRDLIIARDGIAKAVQLADPDGNHVTLVPHGDEGTTGIAVRLLVSDLDAARAFYGGALQLSPTGISAFACGDSIITPTPDPSVSRTEALRAPGYRYITIQVWDVEAEHAGILARGGEEGRPPVTLGATARVSFVRDPDGNWIEISQRASLTGALPAPNP
jgi:lactoylglutathione lyase